MVPPVMMIKTLDSAAVALGVLVPIVGKSSIFLEHYDIRGATVLLDVDNGTLLDNKRMT